jgi:hypothetical protein
MSIFQPRSCRFKLFTQALLPLALMLTPNFPGKLFAQATTPPDQAWQMRFDGNDAVVMPVDAVKTLGPTYTIQIWVSMWPSNSANFTETI